MSVTAKQLSKSGARGKDLDSVVRDQLQIIDEKLLHADRTWGRNVVAHDLPTVVGLPGLDKKDAQRIVYSAVLRSLEKRGFEARILLEEARTTVYIAWATDLDTEEVDAMNRLIRLRRIQAAELGAFALRGDGPPPGAARHRRAARPPGGARDDEAATGPTTEPAPASSAETALLES